MEAFAPNPVPYDELRSVVRNGDLLLWRPATIAGRIICLASSLAKWRRIQYSHASMAAYAINGRLYGLEQMQWVGGRHVLLSRQVAQYPGSCEVWRPLSPDWDGDKAVSQMMWLLGQHYSWRNLARVSLHMFLPKLVLRPRPNSLDPDQPLVCSSSYHWAARTGGGVAPCPDKVDSDVSPADLALSGFAKYLATPVL